MAAGTAVAVGGVGALTGLLNPSVLIVLVVGSVLVALIMAGYAWFLKFKDKGKSGSFMQRLKSAAGATPAAVADPAKRARLDDLRRKFEEGVEKFRSAGKDIYSLPWYLVVGPSGSGKTEAIRHCGVGFPPGLQDCLQGTGGTVNMHWWFTNHAVMVDTAGRMFMEEVGAGTSSEWKEFLKLLRQTRPTAPINGMLLFIGIDSLIKESAEKIESTAGAIARQLDTIQRTLDVRFPVYVVISKCDLIPGFREFFDGLNDPQAQCQMLGWSNPASLDEVFKPDLVDEHIRTVRLRLLRRRAGILQDPVHSQDPGLRRTNEVDELFSLPDNLAKIAPRLRRYLELIFVAGEWSPKPLFLRGIYFTSSMREGEALDQDLAAALGVSLDSLPGGKAWERDRSYFLRDLFMNKTFREKGLVTRDSNVTGAQRKRTLVLSVAGIAAAVVFLVAAWFAKSQLGNAIGPHAAAWQAVRDVVTVSDAEKSAAIVPPKLQVGEFTYRKSPVALPGVNDPLRVAQLPDWLSKNEYVQPVQVPAVFRPLSAVLGAGDGFRDKLLLAQRDVVEHVAVAPAAAAAYVRLCTKSSSGETWNSLSTSALAELLRVETLAAGKSLPTGDAKDDKTAVKVAPPDVGALLPVAMRSIDAAPTEEWIAKLLERDSASADKPDPSKTAALAKDIAEDVKAMQTAATRVYESAPLDATLSKRIADLVSRINVEVDRSTLVYSIDKPVQRFVDAWEGRAASDTRLALARLAAIRTDLAAFKKQRDDLRQRIDDTAKGARAKPITSGDYEQFVKFYQDGVANLAAIAGRLTEMLKNAGDSSTLDLVIENAARETKDAAKLEFDLLASQLPRLTDKDKEKGDDLFVKVTAKLADGRDTVLGKDGKEGRIDAVAANLKRELNNDDYRELIAAKGGKRGFVAQADLYADSAKRISVQTDTADVLLKFKDEFAAVDAAARGDDAGDEYIGRAMQIARAGRVGRLSGQFIDALSKASGTGVSKAISDLAATGGEPMKKLSIPLLADDALTPNPAFDPGAGSRVVGAWTTITAELNASLGGKTLPLADRDELLARQRAVTEAMAQYQRDYIAYWGAGMAERLKARTPRDWSDFVSRSDELKTSGVEGINDDLRVALAAAAKALEPLAADKDAKAWKDAADRAIAALETKRAKQTVSAIRDWRDATSWSSVRSQIIKTKDVLTEFFPVYEEPKEKESYAYWNSVCEAVIDALLNSAKAEADGLRQQLLSSAGFPLVKDAVAGTKPLQRRDLAELNALLDKFDASSASAAANWGRTGLERKAKDLSSNIAQLAGVGDDQLRKLKGVTKAITEKELKATLSVPTTGAELAGMGLSKNDSDQQFLHEQQKLEFRSGDRSVLGMINVPSPAAANATLDVPDASDATLVFPDNGQSKMQDAGAWWVLKAALSPDAKPLPDGRDGGTRVLAPFTLPSGARYWIVVEFSRKLPAAGDWPRVEDLPRGK
ncbi:MAG: type VI secretion protein IcmF/TssM N-terminal domain-containing protein [Planctomycetota bacterium]|nr:type VI secretion protein IcmF/TssM N-terminal domain-containing protein [Planctomycetota bacterium]